MRPDSSETLVRYVIYLLTYLLHVTCPRAISSRPLCINDNIGRNTVLVSWWMSPAWHAIFNLYAFSNFSSLASPVLRCDASVSSPNQYIAAVPNFYQRTDDQNICHRGGQLYMQCIESERIFSRNEREAQLAPKGRPRIKWWRPLPLAPLMPSLFP